MTSWHLAAGRRGVINVAYLLGTELCVFSAPRPPPKKKKSTLQNEDIHFSRWLPPLLPHSFSFWRGESERRYRRGRVAEKHLTPRAAVKKNRGCKRQWAGNCCGCKLGLYTTSYWTRQHIWRGWGGLEACVDLAETWQKVQIIQCLHKLLFVIFSDRMKKYKHFSPDFS